MAEGETLRFPALHKSVQQIIQEQKNKQTLSKTGRDVGLLSEFLKSKQENRNIEEMQPQELPDFLSEFIVTVKRKHGGDYEPSSLRGFIASFISADKKGAGCSLQSPEKERQGKQAICIRGYQR